MIRILQTNDFHGTLTEAAAQKIRQKKVSLHALYFDGGDVIRTGNLGIPLRPEPAWGLLDLAGCDASVLGNRESHPLAAAFLKKLEGARHPLLAANLRPRGESAAATPWQSHVFFDRPHGRVAVFGVMVAMVTERMKSQVASAYLWDSPLIAAAALAKSLRTECDVLIALTHIGFTQDERLAELAPEIDVILGAHSHTVLEQPVLRNRTWIAQTGSHGRFVGVYEFDGKTLAGTLEPLL